MVKYYSDVLNKKYDTAEEAMNAEAEYFEAENKKKAEEAEKLAAREKAEAEVKAALEAYNKAEEEYRKKLNDFLDKYGIFSTTTVSNNKDKKAHTLADWFDDIYTAHFF